MTNQEYADLLRELQILYEEARLFPWKGSEGQVDLLGRLDSFHDKLSLVPLCADLTAEYFRGQMLGSKQERATIVNYVTHALSVHAFNSLAKEVDR